jgi:hypothetical protein
MVQTVIKIEKTSIRSAIRRENVEKPRFDGHFSFPVNKNRDGFYGSGDFRKSIREDFPVFDSGFCRSAGPRASGPLAVEVTGTLTIKYTDPRNAKTSADKSECTHSHQIKQITASIQEFGFINPILLMAPTGLLPATPGPKQRSPWV